MLSIPEIAAQILNKSLQQPDEDQSCTIFLVGSKSVGKSTILNSFLDKSDSVRETTVLEYSFGRKSSQKQSLDKTVCHIWEYGGKLEMFKNVLISIPKQGKTYFCIVLDLSKVKSLWTTLETCIQAIIENYEGYPKEIIIMGGRYDIFNNYDGEIKKHLNTIIRSVALICDAHVIYYSIKDPHQLKKAQDLLRNISFGNGVPFKEKNIHPTKPLMIPKQSDTWESIGIPVSDIEKIKMRHMTRFQPETVFQETSKLELQPTHPEPVLDSLMAIKYKELRNLELFEPSMDEYFGHMH